MPHCHSNSNKLHQQQEARATSLEADTLQEQQQIAAAITLQKATLQTVTAEHQKLLEQKQRYLKKQHHQLCLEP